MAHGAPNAAWGPAAIHPGDNLQHIGHAADEMRQELLRHYAIGVQSYLNHGHHLPYDTAVKHLHSLETWAHAAESKVSALMQKSDRESLITASKIVANLTALPHKRQVIVHHINLAAMGKITDPRHINMKDFNFSTDPQLATRVKRIEDSLHKAVKTFNQHAKPPDTKRTGDKHQDAKHQDAKHHGAKVATELKALQNKSTVMLKEHHKQLAGPMASLTEVMDTMDAKAREYRRIKTAPAAVHGHERAVGHPAARGANRDTHNHGHRDGHGPRNPANNAKLHDAEKAWEVALSKATNFDTKIHALIESYGHKIQERRRDFELIKKDAEKHGAPIPGTDIDHIQSFLDLMDKNRKEQAIVINKKMSGRWLANLASFNEETGKPRARHKVEQQKFNRADAQGALHPPRSHPDHV